MNTDRLTELLATGETLACEFKSESKRLISDNEIYQEVVAMANSKGGVLLIGVEDDGTVTGARPRHGGKTDPARIQTAIFNNTVPCIQTRATVLPHENCNVLAIEVDAHRETCSTAAGKSLRRATGGDGRPASVPYYPHEHVSRRIDAGLIDYSANALPDAQWSDLDTLEFDRLRKTIQGLGGDRNLLNLTNEDLAKALRLVESQPVGPIPNVAALLLLGRPERLQALLPAHEIRFQVLDRQGNVRVNDLFNGPILLTLEEIERRFKAHNAEQEVSVGLFRLPVPDYSLEGFREALNNAVLHRDYARLGAVYVQWHPDHLLITNPGGFPEGITTQNLLVHEPKPRNLRLAEAFRRVGLVEQTGRGVDKIFLGQLRYGRPVPDYSRSDANGVRVVLMGGRGSLEFAAFVYKQDRDGQPLSLDEMLVLNQLFLERRIASDQAGQLIQKGLAQGRSVLERLQERGLLTAKGEKRGRVYHLSAEMYQRLGQPAAYVRSHGIDRLRQEALVLEYVEAHTKINRPQVVELCGITEPQASRVLHAMCQNGKLKKVGDKRWTYYVKA